MNKNERLLFLKYAIPCATTLVKRKTISKEFFKSLLNDVKKSVVTENEPEKIFKIAFGVCTAMALKQGKKIDEKIIRSYYWFGHDAVVEERHKLVKDFDAKRCKTYPGIVKKIKESSAVVKTAMGEHEYLTDLVSGLKQDSSVMVHRNFVIEKISEKKAFEVAQKTGKFYA